MSFEKFLFYIFALVLIIAAARVITVRNPVHAVLFLVLAFFNSAALWLLLEAEFLAITLVLVYVGAVMVLFLFAILLINVPQAMRLRQWTRQSSWAISLAALIGLVMMIAMGLAFRSFVLPPEAMQQPLGTPRDLGTALFTEFVLPFEIASIILLAAMIGAIVLARETALEEESLEEASRPPALPGTPQDDRQPV